MKMIEAAGIFILLVLFLLILSSDDSTEMSEPKKPHVKIRRWVQSPAGVFIPQYC